jgi:hypothetical protein
LTIRLNIKESKVNFDKFLYKRINITNNLPDLKTVITLALELADNIKANNISPPVASSFISIQIEAPAIKGAKRTAFKYSIYFNFSSDNEE